MIQSKEHYEYTQSNRTNPLLKNWMLISNEKFDEIPDDSNKQLSLDLYTRYNNVKTDKEDTIEYTQFRTGRFGQYIYEIVNVNHTNMDLITNVSIEIKLPTLPKGFTWKQNIGTALIKNIEFESNGTPLHVLTNDAIYIKNKLNNIKNIVNGNSIIVNIPFWFSDNNSSLDIRKLKCFTIFHINIEFENIRNLVEIPYEIVISPDDLLMFEFDFRLHISYNNNTSDKMDKMDIKDQIGYHLVFDDTHQQIIHPIYITKYELATINNFFTFATIVGRNWKYIAKDVFRYHMFDLLYSKQEQLIIRKWYKYYPKRKISITMPILQLSGRCVKTLQWVVQYEKDEVIPIIQECGTPRDYFDYLPICSEDEIKLSVNGYKLTSKYTNDNVKNVYSHSFSENPRSLIYSGAHMLRYEKDNCNLQFKMITPKNNIIIKLIYTNINFMTYGCGMIGRQFSRYEL
jgi:hypothetical protein